MLAGCGRGGVNIFGRHHNFAHGPAAHPRAAYLDAYVQPAGAELLGEPVAPLHDRHRGLGRRGAVEAVALGGIAQSRSVDRDNGSVGAQSRVRRGRTASARRTGSRRAPPPDSGPGGGASKLTGDVTQIISQLPPIIESLTGVKFEKLLEQVPALKKAMGKDEGEAK